MRWFRAVTAPQSTRIPDRDIHASAMEINDAHGSRAIVFVERRWTEMEGAGDGTGLHHWRRIVTAVFDLLRDEPDGALS